MPKKTSYQQSVSHKDGYIKVVNKNGYGKKVSEYGFCEGVITKKNDREFNLFILHINKMLSPQSFDVDRPENYQYMIRCVEEQIRKIRDSLAK